ncbi:hypothetical protein GCM10010533_17460 [Mycolicibacterium pallens]
MVFGRLPQAFGARRDMHDNESLRAEPELQAGCHMRFIFDKQNLHLTWPLRPHRTNVGTATPDGRRATARAEYPHGVNESRSPLRRAGLRRLTH